MFFSKYDEFSQNKVNIMFKIPVVKHRKIIINRTILVRLSLPNITLDA